MFSQINNINLNNIQFDLNSNYNNFNSLEIDNQSNNILDAEEQIAKIFNNIYTNVKFNLFIKVKKSIKNLGIKEHTSICSGKIFICIII